jgi:hypothetical protein
MSVHWSKKYQKCGEHKRDIHNGKLELITWNGKEDGEELGWGAVILEEAEDHKKNFVEKYKSDEEAFYVRKKFSN